MHRKLGPQHPGRGHPGAPALDFVLTVCDNAAAEACPVWPRQPVTAHWSIEDPVASQGSDDERRRLFDRVYLELERRVGRFTELGIGSLDRLGLQGRLNEIGATESPISDED